MLQNLESEIQNKWNVSTNENVVTPASVIKKNSKKNEKNLSESQNNKFQEHNNLNISQTNVPLNITAVPNELSNQQQQPQQQQKQQQMQMSYHDIICDHLFQCFTHSIYTDLKLRFQGGSIIQDTTFFLHKIICIRSPLLAQLISETEYVQINLFSLFKKYLNIYIYIFYI